MKTIQLDWSELHMVERLAEMLRNAKVKDVDFGMLGRDDSKIEWDIAGVSISLNMSFKYDIEEPVNLFNEKANEEILSSENIGVNNQSNLDEDEVFPL